MGELNAEMKEIFDNYNKAGNVPPEGFNKDELNNSAKGKAVAEIIRLAEKNIRKNASKVFENFNVEFKYSSSDNSKLGEEIINAIDFNFANNGDKKDLDVSINFNFSKLCQLPPEEVYSMVYATMHSSLLKKREALSAGKDFQFGKAEELNEEPAVNDENFDRQGNYVSNHPIRDFIKKILKILFGDEPDKSIEDYGPIARQIETDFTQSGITAEDMFENPQGNNLIAERYGKVVKQGYQQQATYLLGEISKEDFNSIKTGNDQELRNFCESYAKVILNSSNMTKGDVPIVFVNSGSIGEYMDYGNRQEVRININEIKNINNPAEVVMTLQHELTHAIDSSSNKGKNITTEKGYGLVDNLVGGVHEIDNIQQKEPAKVFGYVKHLQEICYRINPNEQSARIGELAAIKFMKGMNPDKDMQKYIERSIDDYNNYQNNVLKNMNECETVAQEYETEIKHLVVNQSTHKIIGDRLNYIESLKQRGKLDPNQVKEAIAIAMGEKKQMQNPDLAQTEVEMTAGE